MHWVLRLFCDDILRPTFESRRWLDGSPHYFAKYFENLLRFFLFSSMTSSIFFNGIFYLFGLSSICLVFLLWGNYNIPQFFLFVWSFFYEVTSTYLSSFYLFGLSSICCSFFYEVAATYLSSFYLFVLSSWEFLYESFLNFCLSMLVYLFFLLLYLENYRYRRWQEFSFLHIGAAVVVSSTFCRTGYERSSSCFQRLPFFGCLLYVLLPTCSTWCIFCILHWWWFIVFGRREADVNWYVLRLTL